VDERADKERGGHGIRVQDCIRSIGTEGDERDGRGDERKGQATDDLGAREPPVLPEHGEDR
jgi:hypothetical protein